VLRQIGDAADGLDVRRGQVLQSHALLPLAGGIFPLNALLAAGCWLLAARVLGSIFGLFHSKRVVIDCCTMVSHIDTLPIHAATGKNNYASHNSRSVKTMGCCQDNNLSKNQEWQSFRD